MAEQKKPRRASHMAAYAIIGLLMLALAGFGVQNFNMTITTVAQVGAREISTERYVRALRDQQQNFSHSTGQLVSFAQMREAGLDRAILGLLIHAGALEDETWRLGISVDDARLSEAVLSQLRVRGLDGQVDKDIYRRVVREMGMTIKSYERDLRLQVSALALRRALENVALPNETYIEIVRTYLNERRSFEWAELTKGALGGQAFAPSLAELRTYYEAHPEEFTRPETRYITYVGITPDMLAPDIVIEEAAIRALYEERAAILNRPERRLVERLVFSDMEKAQSGARALAQGETDFETLVSAQGLLLEDVDLGQVEKGALFPSEAGAVVFGLEAPGVTDVVMSDIGPAIFRVKAILAPTHFSYEMLKESLRDELAGRRAVQQIRAFFEPVDDLLSAGASLEEVAEETGLRLGEVGLNAQTSEGFGADNAFRRAGFEAGVDDFPELVQREDEGIFALRLDRIEAPKLQPQHEVESQLLEAWRRDAEQKALRRLGAQIVAGLEGGQDFGAFGVEPRVEEGKRRLEAGVEPVLLETAFALDAGQAGEVEAGGSIYIVRRIETEADTAGEQSDETYDRALRQQFERDLRSDIISAVERALVEARRIRIDDFALEQIATQF